MKDVAIGASLRKEIVVADEHLACQVGSGNVSVYATPMMLALMEGAAAELLASFLEGDETSVGSRIESTHLAPTPAGMKVTASAEILSVQGRQVRFRISASDESGLIGEGSHDRVVVLKSRFEEKAQAKAAEKLCT
ncbi:MAG: thioesterase family protein [Oscillospiraceae bacterium]|jgi:fluoroacetyl-CoA thioesterase|nr:thioesterase family protein [Oscillospiraceae bacterium]